VPSYHFLLRLKQLFTMSPVLIEHATATAAATTVSTTTTTSSTTTAIATTMMRAINEQIT